MNEKDMQHGKDYSGQNVNGYIATEKFNGCRAYWDGENLWSRGGIKINIPASWRDVLPRGVHLDGEVYDGIDGLARTASAVKYGNFTPSMKFMVFDSPSFTGKYQDRLSSAKKYESGPIVVIPSFRITNIVEAISKMKNIQSRGGEGLVLRVPNVQYAAERTAKLIKLKKDTRREGLVQRVKKLRWEDRPISYALG
jgi:DNA ligase-1